MHIMLTVMHYIFQVEIKIMNCVYVIKYTNLLYFRHNTNPTPLPSIPVSENPIV